MGSNPEKIDFINRLAPYAMEAQLKYGIPSSVTIAQAIVESGYGKSTPINSNNVFGIKASSSWKGPVAYNGKTREAYRAYSSVAESVEDHSRLLLKKHYSRHIPTGSIDPNIWLQALQKGGYSTTGNYISRVANEIKDYNLHKFDIQASQWSQESGFKVGNVSISQQVSYLQNQGLNLLYEKPGRFNLPIAPDKVIVTDTYTTPRKNHKGGIHGGLDLSTKGANLPVFSTEDNGKVVDSHYSRSAGNMITVEYERPQNQKIRVTYMHLSQLGVKTGDAVNAGQQIGISGNTGNSHGAHLHLKTEFSNSGGVWQTFDPMQYLAELEFRGNLNDSLKNKEGKEMLTQHKGSFTYFSNSNLSIGNQIYAARIQEMMQNPEIIARLQAERDPEKWLLNKIGLSSDEGEGKDAFSQLIAALIKKATNSLVQLQLLDLIEKQQGVQKTEIAKAETMEEQKNNILRRERESVNLEHAPKLSSKNYDTISQQQNEQQIQQQQNARMA